ncbi:uncharacterized protein LOC106668656 isoform X2 [Cimex lectularius]|uniref:Uncharacterized protein n=1 Tax=Cimex lectularius TaxID=79782 RepID=A0A8I6SRM1_CIMLE|nr:uncharacterized protein LOC106668656 isoform X2 [Cimex lectularius]
MLGTRLRSWMETHIVRARKKQNRSKGKGKNPQDSPSTSPRLSYEQSSRKESQISKESSQYSVDKTPMTDDQKEKGNAVTNLSSPESAYSTGYSTDGTSPGASIPPEYYINLRTGKHYVQANTGNTGTSEAVQCSTAQTSSPKQGAVLTPASARRRREELLKRKVKPADNLPESSTEEDIADRHAKSTPSHKVITPKSQRKNSQLVQNVSHRRTESFDGGQRFNLVTERDSEGSSSTHTAGSIHCVSPFLSSASPRQRNRIRTNPWLGTNNLQMDKGKNYNSPGETSSTVGSSSTLSSSGYRERLAKEEPGLYTPTLMERKIDNIRNVNVVRSGTYVASPLVNGRRPINTMTTCSPQLNRPCRHILPGTSSSSTSAPSSGSDDNHHGNSSDFSDDDVTLNEMLGKYDESYVYEKETDILSDSDPTDCEEQHDYNGKVLNKGHCMYVGGNHTPDMCKRQCLRMRRQRSSGDGSVASSHGSSLCNRRRRASSRKSEDSHHPSAETTPKRYKKRHKHSSRERIHSAECLPREAPLGKPLSPNIRTHAIPDSERVNYEQGRHVNLNRVLMERIINQRSGTRSADGTPVSLRRNGVLEYNGKYLKNPHVSKLINSNSVEKRNGFEEKNIPKRESPMAKKRSNSIAGYNDTPPALPPRNNPRLDSKNVDKEGDMKYRELIREAENLIGDFRTKPFYHPEYMSPTLSTKSAIVPNTQPHFRSSYLHYPNECDIKSQINLLEETINNNPVPKIENEEGIFKTISKTLEKIIVRNTDSKKSDKSGESLKSKKKQANQQFQSQLNKSPKNIERHSNMTEIYQENDYVNNAISLETTSIDRNENLYKNTITFSPRLRNQNTRTHSRQNSSGGEREQFKLSKGADIIRNGDQTYSPSHMSPKIQKMNTNPFKSRNTLTLWQDNEIINIQNSKIQADKTPTPKTPLVPFKSFDLGNQVAVESKYCPQSEPVKRKVYVCSSTFDKLQKTLLKNPPDDYDISNMSTDAIRDENLSLKEKVEQLRRERIQVEARVRETQEQIDRLRLADSSSHC